MFHGTTLRWKHSADWQNYTFTKGTPNLTVKQGRWSQIEVMQAAELYRGTVTLDNNSPEDIWAGTRSSSLSQYVYSPSQLVSWCKNLKDNTPTPWRTNWGTDVFPGLSAEPCIANNQWIGQYAQVGYYWEVNLPNYIMLVMRVGIQTLGTATLTKSGVSVSVVRGSPGFPGIYEIGHQNLSDQVFSVAAYEGSPNPGLNYYGHVPYSYYNSFPEVVSHYYSGTNGFSPTAATGPRTFSRPVTVFGEYSNDGLIGLQFGTGLGAFASGSVIVPVARWVPSIPTPGLCAENGEVEFTLQTTHISNGSTANIGPTSFPSKLYLNIGPSGL